MSKPLRVLRNLLIGAAFVALLYLVLFLEIRVGDPRPRGTADDIEALAERDDVNVLFILVDTLRAHRLGCYGYDRDTSPTIDALAATGVRFAHQLSQSSWTKCSMASMWTGLYPANNRITRFEDALPDAALMPAEIFRNAGFRTGGVYRNGWVAPNFGFAQGFENYGRPVSRPVPKDVKRENPTVRHGGLDDDLVDETIEFLRVHGRERWLLYLHLMDVHEYIYDESTALFGTAYSDVYDNAIARTNRVLRNLFDYLDAEGYRENTLIVLASDHGEAFSERGLEGHARYVYRETTEVPFVIGFPFELDPGVVVTAPTANVDVWPTVLDLVGLPPLPGTDGRSRRPEILAAARGTATATDGPALVAHLDRHWGQRARPPAPTVALREGSLRFVRTLLDDGTVREELFDSASDPRELKNVLDERPEDAARLRAAASRYLEASALPPWGEEAPELQIDEIELNQLRALGYSIP